MVFGIVIATLAVAFLAICLGVALWAYRFTFRFVDQRTAEERMAIPEGAQYQKEKKWMMDLMKGMDELPYEEVFITSFDGLKLAGKYYYMSDDAPLQIMMHGYKSNPLRDFCGGHKVAQKMGMNTLVIDQRAHGNSEGHTLTFGVNERQDCLSWIKYANGRFGKDIPIFVVGLSMGAATVLMASDLEMPENVKGIIADCPYSSPKAIICKVGKQLKLPVKTMYPLVVLGAKLFGHFNLNECSAVEAVKHTKVPILLIHGEADRFVPCDMAREIYEANKKMITLETFPEAGHGLSYIEDCERYEKVIREFVEKNWASKGMSV